MRTVTTVTYSSQVDGRHSQKDIDLLTGTCDFILYLPAALLSLLSRAEHRVLVQGFYRDTAGRATSHTHSDWPLNVAPLDLLTIQSASKTIKSTGKEYVGVEEGCSDVPTLHSHI